MKKHRSFRAGLAALWLASAAAPAAVVLDAPGHAATEGAAVAARGGEPGSAWRLVDWRGREVEGAAGAFDERGETILPPLPAGYYRMVAADSASEPPAPRQTLATLAVVSPLVAGAPDSPFAVDTASTWISLPGAFLCPWNGGDTERTVADLVQLCGFRHVRDRLRWGAAQPSPDAPTREWETRYVDIPPDADLSAVTLLRVGANPQGSRLTLWVRNLQFLKPTDRPSP